MIFRFVFRATHGLARLGKERTELFDEVGSHLARVGNEFGATTGRPRRCGWFDGYALKQVANINSMSGVCITKLDVLDGLEKLSICVDYEVTKEEVLPVYLELPGWQETTAGIKKLEDLPVNARAYLDKIEEICDIRIDVVSTGPDREHTVMINEPF